MSSQIKNIPRLRFKEYLNLPYMMESLSDVLGSISTGVSVNSYDYQASGDSKGILKTSCILNGKFIETENKTIIESDVGRAKNSLVKNTILVSRMNTPDLVGEVGYIPKDYPNLFVPDRLWVLACSSKILASWLTYYFISPNTKFNIKQLGTGTSNSMKNISQKEFLLLNVYFPLLPEQQKIADFLSSVDQKIQHLKQKQQLLQQYKKGIMQKLFSQQIRFKDEKGMGYPEWELFLLKDLSNKVMSKNKDEKINLVLTNSAKQGIVNQTDYFTKDIANENNLGNYTIVDINDFVYNPRISELAPYGPIKRNHIGVGVMSPLYTVFRFEDKSLLNYIEYFFGTDKWHRYMWNISNFGARSDRMNISNNDFFHLSISIPCKKERIKIADFLSSLDKKIEYVNSQITQTEQFKKGLLQQLLV